MHFPCKSGIFLVVGALVLIDKYPVFAEDPVAVLIKFCSEQPLSGTCIGVGGVHYYQVVRILRPGYELDTVSHDRPDTGVGEAACHRREESFGCLYHVAVDLYEVDPFQTSILHKLSHRAAVPSSDDQCLFRFFKDGHRDMDHHLVIDELVLLGQHYVAVYEEYFSERLRIEDLYILKFASATVQNVFFLYSEVRTLGLPLNVPGWGCIISGGALQVDLLDLFPCGIPLFLQFDEVFPHHTGVIGPQLGKVEILCDVLFKRLLVEAFLQGADLLVHEDLFSVCVPSVPSHVEVQYGYLRREEIEYPFHDREWRDVAAGR